MYVRGSQVDELEQLKLNEGNDDMEAEEKMAYQKGFDRGLDGKQDPDTIFDALNILRSEGEKSAQEEGWKAGLTARAIRGNHGD